MNSVIRFFAERPAVAYVFTVMVLVLGVGCLVVVKRDNFPKVDFDEITIVTRYPGAAPQDVELNVTDKIEDALRALEGIDEVASHSMENLSIVRVLVDPDATDKRAIKTHIRDAVAGVSDLPPEVEDRPQIEELTTATSTPVLEIGITGERPYPELRETARRLEKRLLDLEGVGRIVKHGYLDREVRIELSPDALAQWQIPIGQVVEAVENRNIRATAGSIESDARDRNIVTLGQLSELSTARDLVVHTTPQGTLIRLGDLAKLSDGFAEPHVLSRMNGKPSISLWVYKKEAADIIRTVDAVRSLVGAERTRLVDGLDIEIAADVSRLARNRLEVVASNGLMGLALVLLVLWLFLDLRSALWVAVSIPVVLLGTLALLPVFGAYLDTIALAAMTLVVGIIVDDGIIVAESVRRCRERGVAALEAAVEGTASVFKPVVTTLATTALAFGPMLFMSGTMGDFVYVIPLVVLLALAVSLTEVTVALPAHLIPGRASAPMGAKRQVHFFAALQRMAGTTASVALRFRLLVVAGFIVLLASSVWYAGRYMDFTLFPTRIADGFYMLVEMPVDFSLQRTGTEVQALERLVDELPPGEVDSYVTRIGSHDGFNPGESGNWAAIGVYLTPHAQRSRDADQIVATLRARAAQIPDVGKLTFVIDSGGPPVGRPISIRVTGDHDAARRQAASAVVDKLAEIEGVSDIERDDKRGKDFVRIDLDYVKLGAVGLSVADVARTVRLAYAGEVVTSVRRGNEQVDFRLIFDQDFRANPDHLADLTIATRDGRFVRLDEVASFPTEAGPMNVHHFDYERSISVSADADPAVTSAAQVLEQVLAGLDQRVYAHGIGITVDGETEATSRSMRSLGIAFAVAAIGIYVALLLLFNSMLQPLVVMAAIPFALPGIIAAFAIHHQALGFLALLGVVGLSGVVVNDSLVLLHTVNELRANRPKAPLVEILVASVCARIRPIMLTSITTIAGLLPMAYGFGGSDPFSAPMALALGYGVFFASPMTLILLPCVLMVMNDMVLLAAHLVPGKRQRAPRAEPSAEGVGLQPSSSGAFQPTESELELEGAGCPYLPPSTPLRRERKSLPA